MIRRHGRLEDLKNMSYAPVALTAGTIALRCPSCGAENPRHTYLLGRPGASPAVPEGVPGQRPEWTGQSLRGLPMSNTLRWVLILVCLGLLSVGAWPAAFVLGVLVFPFSPLSPIGDYILGKRLPIYLTACEKCGGRVAFAGEGQTFLAATAAPRAGDEAPAAGPTPGS